MQLGGLQPPVLQVAAWTAIPGLTHGFLGRRGGTSSGPFADLNVSCVVGDDPVAVEANWLRAALVAGGGPFVRMHQVHGTRVVRVWSELTEVGEADAVTVGSPGLTLCVLTADCVPILLVAPQSHAVAAVHAGWKGTLGGVVAAAVRQLNSEFGVEPGDVCAALGPSIGACCYEVDSDLAHRFQSMLGAADGVSVANGTKARLDLRRINAVLLRRAGVLESSISFVGPCTRCNANDFYSHRGSGGRTGRQLSYIGWRN